MKGQLFSPTSFMHFLLHITAGENSLAQTQRNDTIAVLSGLGYEVIYPVTLCK